MRLLHYPRQPRRALALTPSLVALTTLCGLLSAPSFAQDLFVTSDATTAGGNPINGDYGRIVIGQDAANVAYPNITADITGGSSTDDIYATNSSLVTISAGTFGREPAGGVIYQTLGVYRGSTVNLTGGSFRSSVGVGNNFMDDGTISTFSMSGGSVSYIENAYGGIVNVTGGSILGGVGFPKGVVGNYGNGTINVTGGTMNNVGNIGYDSGAVTNFGGAGVADLILAYNGTVNVTGGSYGKILVSNQGGNVNVSGGALGSGGVILNGSGGQVVFTGSGITAAQTGTSSYFDDNYYQNFISATYTVAGTLSDGSAFNTSLSGGADYANDGSTATFSAPTIAPDIFVQTDQTVKGVYNNVNIGIDETFSIPSSPTVTIADGNDTVYAYTLGGSTTNITGGIIRGDLYTDNQSKVNISGGEIDGGIYTFSDSAVTMSGGVYNGYGISLYDHSSFTVQGSGLASDGATAHYFDGYTNYAAAGNFHVTGTLADGNSFDQTILAGGATGDASQQTLVAPIAAPDLYLTQNASVNTFNNVVYVGRGADGSNASPTVAINDGADIAQVFVSNDSVLDVLGGVVRGTISAGKDAEVNISGGTLSSVRQNDGSGNGKMTVSGGSIAYLVPANALTVTGGDITTIDTYSGAKVNIFGGNITNVWGYGPAGYVNILGGSVSNIIGYGQPFNLYGGAIGSGSIINLYGSPFDLFGVGFSITNGVAGTANGRNGVWWDVTGTLRGGQSLNTRYFEANGDLSGPAHLTTTAAAPEPGTLALLVVPCAVFAYRRRRAV